MYNLFISETIFPFLTFFNLVMCVIFFSGILFGCALAASLHSENKKLKIKQLEREAWQKTITIGEKVGLSELKGEVLSLDGEFAILKLEDKRVHISHLRKPE